MSDVAAATGRILFHSRLYAVEPRLELRRVPAPVFISYASPDLDSAITARDDLETDGVECWMAPRDVPPGADFAEVIPAAIAEATVVVLFLSAAANASDNVRREAHLALRHKLPILPVRLEDVQPEGALGFMLADAQWIDAFPRVAPSLGRIRHETRSLLEGAGKKVATTTGRTRFQRILAGAAAWSTVAIVTLLLLVWIQRTWFNLVPVVSVVFLAAREAPLVLLALAGVPALAIATQFWLHRDVRRALSLDALLGLGDTGARVRLAGTGVIVGLLVSAISVAPPAVAIHLEHAPIDRNNPAFTRALAAPLRNYLSQCRSHYVVTTRVGRLNPPGEYVVRIALAPYATRDGIEFGDLLVDARLGLTQADPIADDQRKSGYVDLKAPFNLIVGERIVRVQTTHYRDAAPNTSQIMASIALTDHSRADASPQSIPQSVFCTD